MAGVAITSRETAAADEKQQVNLKTGSVNNNHLAKKKRIGNSLASVA